MTQQGKTMWYLRTDAETFGPETQEKLIAWAQTGRIFHGHDVSQDGVHWVPATSVDFLDMRWCVTRGDDEDPIGPLNRVAAETLLASGKVPPDARIVPAEMEDDGEAVASETSEPVETISETETAEEPCAVVEPAALDVATARAEEAEAKVAQATKAREEAEHRVGTLQEALDAAMARAKDAEAKAAQATKSCEEVKHRAETVQAALDAVTARVTDVEAKMVQVTKAREEAEQRVVTVQKALDAATAKVAEAEANVAQVTASVAAKNDGNEALKAAVAAAEARANAAEAELAELLSVANARDEEYQKKLEVLEGRLAQVPPDVERGLVDQSVIYNLMKQEADDLNRIMEDERSHVEQLKTLANRRREQQLARQQMLLNRIAGSPEDMVRRAMGNQAGGGVQMARLRQELDTLRLLHENESRVAQQEMVDAQNKIRLVEQERDRLRAQVSDGDEAMRQLRMVQERLAAREKEILSERQQREEERQQTAASHQALMARIETLEQAARSVSGEVCQHQEARQVKLASWMALKK